MIISQAGIDLIKHFEGCKLKAYKPVKTEKYWTIGFGHSGEDVTEGMKITQHQADELLKHDLEKFSAGVAALVKVTVNQNQFDSLVSFAYNCGTGALKESTLLELVNKGNFDEAALEFEKWTHAGGHVLEGLVKRRQMERSLFQTHVEEPKKAPPVKPEHVYGSLVDYLAAHNKPSDFTSRKRLAKKYNISKYEGTAEQNIKLLELLQK